jgi:hypothetical protein
MEVHHHPEVEKKGFKEYILEGLMIFLAVMMGFFAEGIREGIGDRAKGNEYIISMIEDARTDTAAIHWCIKANLARLKAIHSVEEMCFDYDSSTTNDATLYRLYLHATYYPEVVDPVERTMSQMKNSGGMRLIRKKAAADSIIAYDEEAKKLKDQQVAYERYLNNWAELTEQIFNLKYWSTSDGKTKLAMLKPGDAAYSDMLLTHDKKTLTIAGNAASVYGGVVAFYVERLREMEMHSTNLIHTLQKEYGIKDK